MLWWWCPGCRSSHAVPVEGPKAWKWNRSVTEPTLSPSVLVRWEHSEEREKRVCHLLMREGVLEFLRDSTHELAGQRVPMEPEDGVDLRDVRESIGAEVDELEGA